MLSPNLQHGVGRQTFKEDASLDFGLDNIPIHIVAEVRMGREHDSSYRAYFRRHVNNRWSAAKESLPATHQRMSNVSSGVSTLFTLGIATS